MWWFESESGLDCESCDVNHSQATQLDRRSSNNWRDIRNIFEFAFMFPALRSSALRRHSPLLKPFRGPLSRRWLHQEESTPKAGYKARRDSWLNPTILVLGFIPIFTFALGTWQLQRLRWKVNLIDELKEKLEREPITLPRQVKYERIFLFRYTTDSNLHKQSFCHTRFHLSEGPPQG